MKQIAQPPPQSWENYPLSFFINHWTIEGRHIADCPFMPFLMPISIVFLAIQWQKFPVDGQILQAIETGIVIK